MVLDVTATSRRKEEISPNAAQSPGIITKIFQVVKIIPNTIVDFWRERVVSPIKSFFTPAIEFIQEIFHLLFLYDESYPPSSSFESGLDLPSEQKKIEEAVFFPPKADSRDKVIKLSFKEVPKLVEFYQKIDLTNRDVDSLPENYFKTSEDSELAIAGFKDGQLLIDVKGDGNCLFYAVKACLHLKNHPLKDSNEKDLRTMAASKLREHLQEDLFKNLLINECLGFYLDKKSQIEFSKSCLLSIIGNSNTKREQTEQLNQRTEQLKQRIVELDTELADWEKKTTDFENSDCKDPFLEDYIQILEKDRQFVGAASIRALSYALEIPILLFENDSITNKPRKIDLSYESEENAIHVLNVGAHFNALIPIPVDTTEDRYGSSSGVFSSEDELQNAYSIMLATNFSKL